MVTVVWINGSINAGKSAVGRHLASQTHARFVEGDDHGAPDDAPLILRNAIAVARIADIIAATKRDLVIAYPLGPDEHRRILDLCTRTGCRLRVVTLAPPLAVAVSDRGRALTERERARIVAMYAEGFQRRGFSELTIDNSLMDPAECARQVHRRLGD